MVKIPLPTLDPVRIVNPRYAGATLEMAGLALLRHKPCDKNDRDRRGDCFRARIFRL